MAIIFIDLEKAYDTGQMEMALATLRWMGFPEAEVNVVEGTYEDMHAAVWTGSVGRVQNKYWPETWGAPCAIFIYRCYETDKQ